MNDPAAAASPRPARRRPAQTDRIRTRLNIMLDETARNERVIAVGRLSLCLVVGASGLGRAGEPTLLWCCGLGAVYSLAMLLAVRSGRYRSRFGYLSVAVDVSLVTGWLLGQVAGGRPAVAVDHGLSAPLYLLAIAVSGLRYNHRLTLFGTILAMGEYALVLQVAMGARAAGAPLDPRAVDWEMQLARLLLIAVGGAVAMFGVRRARELRTAAILDALTGLYNRGYFEERFHLECERAERYQRELTVALFDVDLFKQYNDTHGHTAGDLALQQVAVLLRDGLRRTDTVARYGGEEFCALLPETGKPQALTRLDRLREEIAEHAFHGPDAGAGRLTISIGVVSYPADGEGTEALRAQVDRALYQAKHAGRNCVRG